MRRIRPLRFASRSSLPASAACVVANGVRETLASLLGGPASMRVCEPAIPAASAWPAIVRDALLYRVRGSVADAAIVLRSADAVALAGAIFGESDGHGCARRALSPLERDVIDRTAGAMAANLSSVCGAIAEFSVERVATLAGFITYFELLLEEPVAARIGVALSREPLPEPRGCVEIGLLAGVPIAARASLDLGTIEAEAAARLRPGSVVALRRADLRCVLTSRGQRLASGRCGVRNGRYALEVDAHREAHA